MGKAAKALELISSQIANVSQECFAQASNIFSLNLQAKDEININGMTVDSNMTTTIASCNANTGIEEGVMHKQIDRALDNLHPVETDGTVLDAFSAYNGYSRRVNMRTTIRDSIDVNVANRCLAIAFNSAIFRIKNAQKINITNLNVKQTADAAITECISNVDIKFGNTTQSLKQFLERNEDQYDVEGYGCPGFEEAKNTLAFGSIACYLAVIAVVLFVVIRRYLLKKKFKTTSKKS